MGLPGSWGRLTSYFFYFTVANRGLIALILYSHTFALCHCILSAIQVLAVMFKWAYG